MKVSIKRSKITIKRSKLSINIKKVDKIQLFWSFCHLGFFLFFLVRLWKNGTYLYVPADFALLFCGVAKMSSSSESVSRMDKNVTRQPGVDFLKIVLNYCALCPTLNWDFWLNHRCLWKFAIIWRSTSSLEKAVKKLGVG